MSWIDRPIEPAVVHRRREGILRRDRERKHRENGGYPDGWNLQPVRTIVPWHTDEQGNRARTMGSL
jgi:hypothetical protein